MKEDISSNAVVFNNPYTGELFVFDNAQWRYGYASTDKSLSWTPIHGLNGRPITKIVGKDGTALMQLHDEEKDTYKLLILRERDKLCKIYNTKHYIEPFLGDEGWLSYIDRDMDSMQAYIGYVKNDLTPNEAHDIDADSEHGTYVTMGLFMSQTDEGIEPPEGRHLASGFSFTALNQEQSADVFVVRCLNDSLSLDNRNVRDWIEMVNNVRGQENHSTASIDWAMDEDEIKLEEDKKIFERRLLGQLLDRNATLVAADWNIMGNGDPKEYYDNLHFHHPETYIDAMLMIDRGEFKDKRADLVTAGRDSYLFVTNIWLDNEGKPQYKWQKRFQFDDCIRCLAYDSNRGIVYYAGDSGLNGCLDINDRYAKHGYKYGKADFRMLKINTVTKMVAAYNTDKVIVVFDDREPFSMKIHRQIPLIGSGNVSAMALHGDYLYVRYTNGRLERHTL